VEISQGNGWQSRPQNAGALVTVLARAVLLVADDPCDIERVREALRAGAPELALAVAGTAADATAILDQGTFDCVLLDLAVPGAGQRGLDRFLARTATPVVVLTETDDGALAITAIERGAEDCVAPRGDMLADAFKDLFGLEH